MPRLINRYPNRVQAVVLSLLPFAMLLAAYLAASHVRLAANPGDKLLPAPATLVEAIHRFAFEEDERSGTILLWTDTAASLERLLTALGISASWAWRSASSWASFLT